MGWFNPFSLNLSRILSGVIFQVAAGFFWGCHCTQPFSNKSPQKTLYYVQLSFGCLGGCFCWLGMIFWLGWPQVNVSYIVTFISFIYRYIVPTEMTTHRCIYIYIDISLHIYIYLQHLNVATDPRPYPAKHPNPPRWWKNKRCEGRCLGCGRTIGESTESCGVLGFFGNLFVGGPP